MYWNPTKRLRADAWSRGMKSGREAGRAAYVLSPLQDRRKGNCQDRVARTTNDRGNDYGMDADHANDSCGEIGNEKPITIVSEHWYSADLQMDVKSTHSDPRFLAIGRTR